MTLFRDVLRGLTVVYPPGANVLVVVHAEEPTAFSAPGIAQTLEPKPPARKLMVSNGASSYGNRSFSVECVADVSPGPGKIRIDVSHCGFCGTDLHAYHGNWINVLANVASLDTKCPRSSIAWLFGVYQRSWVAAEAYSVCIPGYKLEIAVTTAAQQRANRNYRARLEQRGFKRFEVMALEIDRELLRTLARHLAEDGPEADRARAAVRELVADEPPKPGLILSALRRSPLVGADLDLSRARADGRRVEL